MRIIGTDADLKPLTGKVREVTLMHVSVYVGGEGEGWKGEGVVGRGKGEKG